jgi:3-hydroxyisobutyrate dehydrogenase-like beta-hydroxyacid dehydrogenase
MSMSPTDPVTEPVTWLGAGRMGEAMAERLLDGRVPAAAWNRSPARDAGLTLTPEEA